ncbi:MAG TPA: hypothetical protein VF533_01445 [Solirubrobacteraceae bacterium]
MPRLLRERLPSLLALATLCAVGPAAALHYLAGREAAFSAGTHFGLVALAAGTAGAAALALTVVGARRHDATTVLLGTTQRLTHTRARAASVAAASASPAILAR